MCVVEVGTGRDLSDCNDNDRGSLNRRLTFVRNDKSFKQTNEHKQTTYHQ